MPECDYWGKWLVRCLLVKSEPRRKSRKKVHSLFHMISFEHEKAVGPFYEGNFTAYEYKRYFPSIAEEKKTKNRYFITFPIGIYSYHFNASAPTIARII